MIKHIQFHKTRSKNQNQILYIIDINWRKQICLLHPCSRILYLLYCTLNGCFVNSFWCTTLYIYFSVQLYALMLVYNFMNLIPCTTVCIHFDVQLFFVSAYNSLYIFYCIVQLYAFISVYNFIVYVFIFTVYDFIVYVFITVYDFIVYVFNTVYDFIVYTFISVYNFIVFVFITVYNFMYLLQSKL